MRVPRLERPLHDERGARYRDLHRDKLQFQVQRQLRSEPGGVRPSGAHSGLAIVGCVRGDAPDDAQMEAPEWIARRHRRRAQRPAHDGVGDRPGFQR